MYRDDSTLLDEHDRAVGAIQIADTLIDECFKASKQLASMEHRWRAVRAIQDDHAEVWRHLDAARRILTARGANTIGYDELRDEVRLVLPVRDDGIDTKPLDNARRAVEALRLAMPGADWSAIEARTRGLAATRFIMRGQRWAAAGIAFTLLCAIGTWAASAVPEKRVDPRIQARKEMKAELAEVVVDRKDRIADLALMIGGRCDRHNVYEYMKLLVMDGRWSDAYTYGEDYALKCGDDPEVRKWSRMAKKKLDKLLSSR